MANFEVSSATPRQTHLPAVVERPQLPALIENNPVKKARQTYALVVASDALVPKSGLVSWAHRHAGWNGALQIGGVVAAFAAGVSTFVFWDFALLVPFALGVGATRLGVVLESKAKSLVHQANARMLGSTDVQPVLDMLHEASPQRRALMRLFVEEETSRLESKKRLTPKAVIALHEALGRAAGGTETLERGSYVVAFVNGCTARGQPTELTALAEHLRAAPAEERVVLGEYLETQLFPNEVPLAHFSVEDAKKLYAIVDKARRGEAPVEALSASVNAAGTP